LNEIGFKTIDFGREVERTIFYLLVNWKTITENLKEGKQ